MRKPSGIEKDHAVQIALSLFGGKAGIQKVKRERNGEKFTVYQVGLLDNTKFPPGFIVKGEGENWREALTAAGWKP